MRVLVALVLVFVVPAGLNGCFPDEEKFKAEKPRIIERVKSYIRTGEHNSARKLINKYGLLDDPELLALREKNDRAQATMLKAELARLQPTDFKRRDEILSRLFSLDDDAGRHYVARLENQKRWDEAKAKIGTFENECASIEAQSLANIMLRKWVKQQLTAPASASFPWRREIEISVARPCDFTIKAWVDSQNEFGAMLRSFYTGKLRRDLTNKDKFTLLQLEFKE